MENNSLENKRKMNENNCSNDDEIPIKREDVIQAYYRIKKYIHKTPVFSSRTLNNLLNNEVNNHNNNNNNKNSNLNIEINALLKCENFQRAGSFKIRGALNKIIKIQENKKKKALKNIPTTNNDDLKLITHSSGNHAQAVALASSILGLQAIIVMPENASNVKVEATKGYGAEIIRCESTLEDREKITAQLIEKNNYTLIHPYDDWDIIEGAGTAALELEQEILPKKLDYFFCPIGGGGLTSGSAIALKAYDENLLNEENKNIDEYYNEYKENNNKNNNNKSNNNKKKNMGKKNNKNIRTKIIAVEPEKADDAFRSIRDGKIYPSNYPDTIADGLRTALSKRTYRTIREYVDEIILVNEQEIIDAMKFLMERMKIIVEPSGAVSLAGAIKFFNEENKNIQELNSEKKNINVGILISGGNIDLGKTLKEIYK